MADDLRAKFELDFAVGSSEPLQAIQGILERIDVALNRLREVTNPFEGLTEPVARATRATTELNETLTRTTGVTETAAEGTTALAETLTRATATTAQVTESVTAMNEVLGATGAATSEAANGLGRMGAEAETAATQVSSAMERAQAAYRASALVPSGPDEAAVGPGYFARVGAAGRGFHDAVQSGMGSAFGAAAAGFGVLAPIHAAAEYDNDLAHIGIGLDLHGAANQQFMAAYGRRLDALARDTGQTSPELAAAAGFFNREGYSSTRLDAVLPQVARIATAYNAAPDAVAKTTFALQENLGIKDTDTSGALAAIALAGKSADLPFEKLAPLFPQVAAAAGQLGVTGRSGVNDLAAAMAVVRKSTGTEGEAATDTRAFIQAITSPHTAKRFAKFGVDLFGTEENARRSGLDPIEAVMQQVNRITHGGQDRKALGELFNNEQDRAFTQAILMHMDQYQQIKARVSAATPEVINKDFETGLQSTLIRLHAFEDALSQTERRIGTAFVPVLNVATMALHGLTIAFDWLDHHTHGLSTDLIAGVGSVLAITAALGALGAVLIPLRAGLVLIRSLLSFSSLASLPALLNPVTLTIVGVTAAVTAGYLAWRNWDRIKPMLSSLGSWISGWAKTIGGYIMAPLHALDQWIDHSSIGQAMDKWLAHPAVPAAVPAAPAGHEAAGGKFGLHVSHDPGLTVRRTSGKPGMVSITPDRGRMVAVP